MALVSDAARMKPGETVGRRVGACRTRSNDKKRQRDLRKEIAFHRGLRKLIVPASHLISDGYFPGMEGAAPYASSGSAFITS